MAAPSQEVAVLPGLVPVAAYVRMSTDRQRYSTANQSQAIAEYAVLHGMVVVKTYADEGKSGLDASGRGAFRQLLNDIQRRDGVYQALLVYDVSRWGRFQNIDESAHYEYMCTRAGVPVHYCAEPFSNDGSPLAALLKNFKRSMDGEYSRVLSHKVFTGQCRLAKLGYFQGGPPGYGLRRQLLGPTGEPKAILQVGESKSIQTDRVRLVPGPEAETNQVRKMFVAYVDLRQSETTIANKLNRRGIVGEGGATWTRQMVHSVLTCERYLGRMVYNRRSFKLRLHDVLNPPALWIRRENLFKPIVSPRLFEKARALLEFRSHCSDEDMLRMLRELAASSGPPSVSLIDEQADMPCAATYRIRFGSLPKAYALAALPLDRNYAYIEVNRALRRFRESTATEIAARLQVFSVSVQHGNAASSLVINHLPAAAVVVLRCALAPNGTPQWRIPATTSRAAENIILIRMRVGNVEALDYFFVPRAMVSETPLRFNEDGGGDLRRYRLDTLDDLIDRVSRGPA